ncbi:MAG: hypothetical protein HOC71_12610 [Candidatus Latescibacteria bacterium]|nr:hypothetical protein [Candidatus Latescibacterota bacterium]
METLSGNISISRIFLCNEAWITFWINNALRLRWAIIWNVSKMLLCRSGWGYHTYTCPRCGGTKKVYHSCKSRFCTSCGKAYADRWSNESLDRLLDVPYKHLYFTIPEQLRSWFLYNRKTMPEVLFTSVRTSLLKYAKQRGFTPGIIMVSHTFGSALKWNPHVHIIITAGGLSHNKKSWTPHYVIPYKIIKPMYQYNFLKLMSAEFRKGKLKVPKEYRHIKTLETLESYLTQFHREKWFVGLGRSLQEPDSKVKYVARYTRRPVLAESKITAFDEKTVTFKYHDKTSGKTMTKTYPVQEFIKKLVTHVPDINCRIIRNAGIFSNRTKGEHIPLAEKALKQHNPKKYSRTTWREMYMKAYGIDPLICKKCKIEMLLTEYNIEQTKDIKIKVTEKHSSILQYFYKTQLAGFP